MKYPLPILLLVFLFALFSKCQCKDESPVITCDSTNTVYLPQTLKDLFLFKEGCWWVYKEVGSGETDSFYVSRFENHTSNNDLYNNKDTKKCYEIFRIYIVSHQLIRQEIIIQPENPDDNLVFNQLHFSQTEHDKSTGNGFCRLNFYGDSICRSEQIQNEITIVDTLKVQNNLFINLYHFSNPTIKYDFFKEAYYARKFGLVKFQDWENKVWELDRYHIIQ